MKKISLPTLYKKTNTGAIQQWDISVEGTKITVAHGQVGGKITKTSDTIKSGKNAGRKNETAPGEQALKEARSQWTKKKKAGYVESMDAAQSGETDELIEGGVLPMLAKVYEDHLKKIKFPVAVQPKLDGHRCIAMFDDQCNVTLWTRTRKPITHLKHIEERLHTIGKSLAYQNYILDGELYNHDLRDKFEELTSAARKDEFSDKSLKIQYHVYDIVAPHGFGARHDHLQGITMLGGHCVKVVETRTADTEEEIADHMREFMEQGYEGAMVRLLGIPYENKRSHQLLKVKKFQDAEFEIINMEEGRGKLQGHAGAFVCKTKDGKEFRAKMSGSSDKLATYWKNKNKYIGQILTVQYQGLTSDGIPRFPVGLRMRVDL